MANGGPEPIEIKEATKALPANLAGLDIVLNESGTTLTYSYDTSADATGITNLLRLLSEAGLSLKDIKTTQSSLEDIFVDLLHSENSGSEQ